jgi:hypothetical protein
VTAPAPERVLRLSLIGWGLGDMAMGRSRTGVAWLVAEALLLAAVVMTTLLWADTTWYLVPYLLGVGFLVAWTVQAVLAVRRARSLQPASPAAPPRSPAAIVAWLTVPLLAWGTGFWLLGSGASSPAGATDAFLARWSTLEPLEPPTDPVFERLGVEAIDQEAGHALFRLRELCDQGALASGCDASVNNLLRDVRLSVSVTREGSATAVAELVRFERFPSRFLGIFQGADLRPVAIETVLTLDLTTEPAAWGAERWTVVNATAGPGVPIT